MRICKILAVICIVSGFSIFALFTGMEYYPRVFGGKFTISASLPDSMNIACAITEFRGTNCTSGPPMQFSRERVGATYDENRQLFSIETLLKHYTFSCQWEPVELQIVANHSGSLNNNGRPKPFLLARSGISTLNL